MELWHRILAALGLHRAGGLDAELQFHVERRIEELRREGFSAGEARRRALVELGGVQQIKEEVRAMRSSVWLETFWQGVRLAARSLRRNPA
ncbi:MAG: permease prefix domain 1-containing protein, partial [Candidatus Acidiferrales bacterium]